MQRPNRASRPPSRKALQTASVASASRRRTSSNEVTATSIWLSSGSWVVIFCSQMPGRMSTRITSESGNRAPSRSASYAMPAMMGIATIRDPIRHQMPGRSEQA